MDRPAFEAALQRDGYEVVVREMAPNSINPDHTHEFDARVMVLSGSMTLAIGGGRQVRCPGDQWDIPAGTLHAEEAGADGVTYMAGRKHRAQAA
jgi:quercetin dioxygenase-like cupin family protein